MEGREEEREGRRMTEGKREGGEGRREAREGGRRGGATWTVNPSAVTSATMYEKVQRKHRKI